ncbi:GDSL-type esterase/lipase family protein [Mucilaginibacter sp. SMC90]|uniref:SGNH/GDSL hydrolase family protein n=1 Tax=Mucilaginibacter sp. SMC90 TaxID=2929803 RepID=UPI001FB23048|nr:GDSL-type esterase/lipase family protein [Mucilaginibacter sp. SMC90]UOE46539.1 GDSL-type esterase/lipase family protein [Mucilaginibacter sp. SMC90]
MSNAGAVTQHNNNKHIRQRVLLFKVIAALLPLLLFVVFELLLRLFNYGEDLSVFIPDKSLPQCMVLNPHLSGRYFNNKANATVGNSEPFARTKPANTLRFFVLGESTTIGFPYMHNGSFHRWLKYRLLRSYPNKNFEIINLSLTAVNSFTVYDIAKALPAYQPDAILVYCGHNEYYGAMGVASTSSLGSNPAIAPIIISLKQLRVVQFVFNLFSPSDKTVDTSKNLMERMVAERRIPFGSKTYKKGIENFTANMDAVCKLFSDRHIPVFLSTLVSNEHDIRPFIDNPQQDAGRLFKKGQAESKTGNIAAAKIAFRQAKEYDELRFRAPEDVNNAIIRLAAKYASVKLVDTRKLFEANSPQQIIGNNLMLEHVHPNLAGYALISEAFYNSLY